jgi:hypothetical protein
VIGTDFIGSCKSNYHTTTKAPRTALGLAFYLEMEGSRHDITEILLKVALNTIALTVKLF